MRPTVEITAFTLTSLSTAVVAARFYCRIWVVGRLKVYDYMTLGALLCTWALCVCNHYQFKFGAGSEQRPPPPASVITTEQIEAYVKYIRIGGATTWYAYHIGYLFSLGSVKLSILVFYLSFATQRTFRILVHVCIGVVAVVSVVSIVIVALQCPKDPLFAVSPGIFIDRGKTHCFDLKIIFYVQAAFNMASDLIILILPLPLLFRLRMHTFKRLSLLAVFSAGLLVPIASGIRFWGLSVWATSKQSRYSGGYVIFWSQVELHTAIICASLPSLQPLFKHIFHKLPSLRQHREPYYYYGDGHNSVIASPFTEARVRCAERDSISDLERPAPSFQPKKQMQETGETKIVILTNDEEIRERVRAFSNHSASVYSQPTSPTHPSDLFTTR